jgi:hypothetical protein
VRFAEDAKMDPSNCLMEALVLGENQEGIRIRRSLGTFPGSWNVSFCRPCVGGAKTNKADAQAAMCKETAADA